MAYLSLNLDVFRRPCLLAIDPLAEAVGGREDVLGRDQAAAAVGLHSAILHRDTSTLNINQSYKS